VIPEEMAWRKMESLGQDVNSAWGKVEGISVMCFLKYKITYRRSRWLRGLRRWCLRPVASWDCRFESWWGHVFCEFFGLSSGGVCDGPNPLPGESHRVYVWSGATGTLCTYIE
jgi:hypothetical protein